MKPKIFLVSVVVFSFFLFSCQTSGPQVVNYKEDGKKIEAEEVNLGGSTKKQEVSEENKTSEESSMFEEEPAPQITAKKEEEKIKPQPEQKKQEQKTIVAPTQVIIGKPFSPQGRTEVVEGAHGPGDTERTQYGVLKYQNIEGSDGWKDQ